MFKESSAMIETKHRVVIVSTDEDLSVDGILRDFGT